MKKIAFCFLIYDIINHEELWNIFFQNVDTNKYNIYIHYKTNTPLQYFEKYKLTNCVPTKYADVSLVIAQNILLQEAMKDNDNQHMIFISNSCIPLKSFDFIYSDLDTKFSYFNIFSHSACFPRCNKTIRFINEKYIQKAAQWCILNRKHTELMINHTKYIDWFHYARTVPDEHCYITNIFYHRLQNEIIATPGLATDATTFTNWEGMNYKYPSTNELKNYDVIEEEELLYLLDSKSLFGRKFTVKCYHSLNNAHYISRITSNKYTD